MPKTRPYLYYDETISLCDECLRRVEAKHVIRDGKVWLYKWCPEHGARKALGRATRRAGGWAARCTSSR
jgi:uncharacterized radical SAM superfamily Fe-S cluster-containing enzyme